MPDKLNTLIRQASQAFERGDYEAVVDFCDQALAVAPKDSPDAAVARSLRRHAVEHELLQAIMAAEEWSKALPLLDEAAQKELTHNLSGGSLKEVRQGWEGARQEQANQQMNLLLEDGERLRAKGDLQGAIDKFGQASELPHLSEATRGNARERLQSAQEALNRQARFKKLHEEALQKQAQGDFPAALQAAQSALTEAPAERHTELRELMVQIEAQTARLGQIERLRQEAQGAGDDVFLAEEKLLAALNIAQELRLESLQNELDALIADAQAQIKQRKDQAYTKIGQGNKALRDQKWEQAEEHFNAAAALAPLDIIDGLVAQARAGKEAGDEVKNLVAAGKKAVAPREKFSNFLRARELAPDFPELDDLIEAARKELAAIWMAATHGEFDLGFETPDDLQDNINQLLAEVGEALGLPIAEERRRIFGRVAVRKLREYVETYAEPKIMDGEFAAAIKVYDDAAAMWYSSDLRQGSATRQRYEGEPLSKHIRREALEARLVIIADQKQLAVQAANIYPSLQANLQSGESALSESQYANARERFELVINDIASQPPDTRFALRGVESLAQHNLSTTLRHWAGQISAEVKGGLAKAAQLRDQGDEHLDEAFFKVDPLKQRSAEIRELRQRFEEVTPAIQHVGWGAPDYQQETEELYNQIILFRNSRAALAEAEAYMASGSYAEAKARFEVIALDTDWGQIAAERVKNLRQLQNLKAKVEKARNDREYHAALDGLGKIISLDGRGEWAKNLQRQLRPLADRRRDVETYLDQARAALDRRDWESAKAHIDKALHLEESYPPALKLQAEAQQGQVKKQAYQKARGDVVDVFNLANSLRDYEQAFDHAKTILDYDPDDRIGSNYHQLCERILDLGGRIRDAMTMKKWSEAEKLLAEAQPYHPDSNYFSSLGREIDQKLAEQLAYEQLLEAAQKALKAKDWATALLKAARASEKRKRVKEPQLIADQARVELLKTVQQTLGRDKTIDLENFNLGRVALEAIRTAEGAGELADEMALLDRARRLLDAQSAIERGDLERAQTTLSPIAEDDPGDIVVQSIYEQAQFAVFLNSGKEALAPPPKYKTAVDFLRKAVNLRTDDEEARRLKEEAELGYGLELFDQALRKGDLDEAGQAVRGLPQESPQVVDACNLLKLVDENHQDAVQKYAQPDHEAALEAVDGILTAVRAARKTFPPAEALRGEILENALERARESESNEDYEQALGYYRLCKEKGLDHIREAGRQQVEAIQNQLEQEFDNLLIRVQRAIVNPDITEPERGALEADFDTALRRLPERSTHHASEFFVSIKGLRPLIAEVDENLARVQNEKQKALVEAQTYEDASLHLQEMENFLEKARSVGVGQFVQRQEIRNLGRELSTHKSLRDETRRKWNEYQRAKVDLVSKPYQKLSHESLTNEQIEQIHGEGIKQCEKVLALNRTVKSLDEDNTYKVRNWPDIQKPDPLEKEYKELQRQKFELSQTANVLKESLKKYQDASEADRQAENVLKKPVQDDQFRVAVDLWEMAIEAYQDVATRLGNYADQSAPVNPLPYTRSLFSACRPLREACQNALKKAAKKRQEANDVHERLLEIRPDAVENYGSWRSQQSSSFAKWSTSARQYAEAAHEHYREIDQLNPYDQDAKSRVNELKKYAAAVKARRNRLLLAGVGGIMVVVIGLAFYLTLRPGGVLNAFTATPTASPTSTYTPFPTGTALPTYTSTPGPTATFTVTPIPPTATNTLPATPTPISCMVINSGWLREEPDSQSTGLTLLSSGTHYRVVNWFQDQNGDSWFKVLFNPGGDPESGYFPAKNFVATCKPDQ